MTRCLAYTNANRRCRKSSPSGSYCHIHTYDEYDKQLLEECIHTTNEQILHRMTYRPHLIKQQRNDHSWIRLIIDFLIRLLLFVCYCILGFLFTIFVIIVTFVLTENKN